MCRNLLESQPKARTRHLKGLAKWLLEKVFQLKAPSLRKMESKALRMKSKGRLWLKILGTQISLILSSWGGRLELRAHLLSTHNHLWWQKRTLKEGSGQRHTFHHPRLELHRKNGKLMWQKCPTMSRHHQNLQPVSWKTRRERRTRINRLKLRISRSSKLNQCRKDRKLSWLHQLLSHS